MWQVFARILPAGLVELVKRWAAQKGATPAQITLA
jgi:hypothetical protein